MSFRRFIYYSTLIGAWAAFIGWALARILVGSSSYLSGSPNLEMSLYALSLGLSVAFGLSLVDALWNFSPSQFVSVFGRVAVAMVIGICHRGSRPKPNFTDNGVKTTTVFP